MHGLGSPNIFPLAFVSLLETITWSTLCPVSLLLNLRLMGLVIGSTSGHNTILSNRYHRQQSIFACKTIRLIPNSSYCILARPVGSLILDIIERPLSYLFVVWRLTLTAGGLEGCFIFSERLKSGLQSRWGSSRAFITASIAGQTAYTSHQFAHLSFERTQSTEREKDWPPTIR